MTAEWTGPSGPANGGMCVWGADDDWDVLCELCGWRAADITSYEEAARLSVQHFEPHERV